MQFLFDISVSAFFFICNKPLPKLMCLCDVIIYVLEYTKPVISILWCYEPALGRYDHHCFILLIQQGIKLWYFLVTGVEFEHLPLIVFAT